MSESELLFSDSGSSINYDNHIPKIPSIDFDFDNYLDVKFDFIDDKTIITVDEPVKHPEFVLSFIVIMLADSDTGNDMYTIKPPRAKVKKAKFRKQPHRHYTLTIDGNWSNQKLEMTAMMESLDHSVVLDVEISKIINE